MFEYLFQQDEDAYNIYLKDDFNPFEDNLLQSNIYLISKSNNKPIPYNDYDRCMQNINNYLKNLKSNSYKNLIPRDIFEYFPIDSSRRIDLLGEYISNTIYCQFLEPGLNPGELIIRLNSRSSNKNLNMLSGFIKKRFGFKNLILIFDYNPNKKINFLCLKGIQDQDLDNFITLMDIDWLESVQSAYTELNIICTILHAYSNLIMAHIICMAKETLKDHELLKLFTINENDIFIKALEVKVLLFNTSILFNTILCNNEEFINFTDNWINDFIFNFDIDNYFEQNIIKNLNKNHYWIPGFKENLELIKVFANSIISKTNTNTNTNTKTNTHIKTMEIWLYSFRNNINKPTLNIPIEKLIQILFVIGGPLYSQTFEYQKIGFTDIVYNHKLSYFFYKIMIGTMELSNGDELYGYISLYKGTKYKLEIKNFLEKINLLNKNTRIIVKNNNLFRA